jgi:hypothetical protein
MGDSALRCPLVGRNRRLLAILGVFFACASPCRPQEFHIGEYAAEALLGEARLREGVQYVSFAGDTAFVDWLPNERLLGRYVATEGEPLTRFQLNVVNLEHVLVGFSGRSLDQQTDAAMLSTLRRVGYRIVSLANNHALDAGPLGVSFSAAGLEAAGLEVIGLRSHPVYFWEVGRGRVAIFSLTAYTDLKDVEGLTLKLDDKDLALIRRLTVSANFRIAFVHLGSMSSYVSEHERAEAARLVASGADLIVFTGTHFIKGFVREKGKPVFFGLGDHLFSIADAGTEDVGMHLVAGFSEGGLDQLFVIPFRNSIRAGKIGPLDPESFRAFLRVFHERSTRDTSRYYSDPRTWAVLSDRLRRLSFSDLKQIRPRQFLYAARIVVHHYPVAITSASALIIVAVVLLVWRIRRSADHGAPGGGAST